MSGEEIDDSGGLGDDLSVRKVKAHTTPEERVRASSLVLGRALPPFIRAARHSDNLAVSCMAHLIARRGSARQRLDTDVVWILRRGPANARRHERARPWLLPLLACVRVVYILSVRRVEDVGNVGRPCALRSVSLSL